MYLSTVQTEIRKLISFGWRVLPCRSKPERITLRTGSLSLREAKTPLLPRSIDEASSDPDLVQGWATIHPDCAWAVATCAEYGVLDIDTKNNAPGITSLESLQKQYGELPVTPLSHTGSGGVHYWFRFAPGTRSSAGTVAPGIDVRAERGYAIVPPSRCECPEHFQAYRWKPGFAPWEVPLATAPEWLSLLANQTGKSRGITTREQKMQPPSTSLDQLVWQPQIDLYGEGVPDGMRHTQLIQRVGRHLGKGDDPDIVMVLAEEWALRCDPPIDDWEEITQSLIRKEQRKTRSCASASNPYLVLSQSKHDENKIVQAISTTLNIVEPPSIQMSPGVQVEVSESGVQPPCQPSREGGLSLTLPARHGILGQILAVVEPECEADPAGILLSLLVCAGNAIGRKPHIQVGPDRHGTNLFAVLCGGTADRKGVAEGVGRYVFGKVCPEWSEKCLCYGLGSGEGLIERLADEPCTGEPPADRRLLAVEREFGSCLRKGRREGNTLADVVRNAWDGQPLQSLTRKSNGLRATQTHISILGNITPEEITELLQPGKGTEAFNGYGNRFLWAECRRTRRLPKGGDLIVLEPFIQPLSDAVAWASEQGQITRDDGAEIEWHEWYLQVPGNKGLIGAMLARAEPQVLRLSLIYALLDRSSRVRREHIRAGIAVWDYCEASVKRLFGSKSQNQAEPQWLQVLNVLPELPDVISKTEIYRVFRNRLKASVLDGALHELELRGMATRHQQHGAGRTAEVWGRVPACVYENRGFGGLSEGTLTGSTIAPHIPTTNPIAGCERTKKAPEEMIGGASLDESTALACDSSHPSEPQPQMDFSPHPMQINFATIPAVVDACLLTKEDVRCELGENVTDPLVKSDPLAFDPRSSPLWKFLVESSISAEECVARYKADPELERRERAHTQVDREREEQARRNAPPDPRVVAWLADEAKRKRRRH